MNDNDISKSIRVGTVDFFGIMIPGVLLIAMCAIGFFVPLISLIMDSPGMKMTSIVVDTNDVLLALFLLVVFSYIFGYILRLSSPDQLDRKSAIKVVRGEYIKSLHEEVPITVLDRLISLKNLGNIFGKWVRSLFVSWAEVKEWIKDDGWPYDPSNPKDKYPYLNFRRYLESRGHRQLAKELVIWGADNSNEKTLAKSTNTAQRSKSDVNKMKLSVRFYCPDLWAHIESKEAHIRLMAGTWAALKFSQWPAWMALIILGVVELAPKWIESNMRAQLSGNNYFVYIFININLLLVIFFCNRRIENLFHYRRVSELFHIVQAAHFANEQKRQRDAAGKTAAKEKKRK